MNSSCIEDSNLSLAWGRALRLAASRGASEIAPLVVAVTGFSANGDFQEDEKIGAELDRHLLRSSKQSVQSVANTIFPSSLWNPSAPRSQLFSRYEQVLPRLHSASSKNRRGLYFERMIQGGPPGRENQLDFALTSYRARIGVRRSILQVGVFQPTRDHSTAALLGFPCLQHVTFAPTREGLCVNAFYAVQYLVERAYGNYVGLCRLGQFVASELKLPLIRLTCFTGIAEVETSKSSISGLLQVVADSMEERIPREDANGAT